jgi:hypothetical protein
VTAASLQVPIRIFRKGLASASRCPRHRTVDLLIQILETVSWPDRPSNSLRFSQQTG